LSAAGTKGGLPGLLNQKWIKLDKMGQLDSKGRLMSTHHATLAELPATPASTVKQKGWKGVMRSLAASGRLVVTNHREPEAVILSIEQYHALVDAAENAALAANDPLVALRRRFDERLSSLGASGASERLQDLMRSPGPLAGTTVHDASA
jgi:hypothetical protein